MNTHCICTYLFNTNKLNNQHLRHPTHHLPYYHRHHRASTEFHYYHLLLCLEIIPLGLFFYVYIIGFFFISRLAINHLNLLVYSRSIYQKLWECFRYPNG